MKLSISTSGYSLILNGLTSLGFTIQMRFWIIYLKINHVWYHLLINNSGVSFFGSCLFSCVFFFLLPNETNHLLHPRDEKVPREQSGVSLWLTISINRFNYYLLLLLTLNFIIWWLQIHELLGRSHLDFKSLCIEGRFLFDLEIVCLAWKENLFSDKLHVHTIWKLKDLKLLFLLIQVFVLDRYIEMVKKTLWAFISIYLSIYLSVCVSDRETLREKTR